MRARDLENFRKLLLAKRRVLAGDVNGLEQAALHNSRQDASGDLSKVPLDMADIGSDNFEQEFTLNLIQTEQETLRDIEDALVRIDGGAYGQCETSGKVIAKTRLKALPHARLCMACKREEEG